MPDIGSPNLTEIQFLQSKSDAGDLVIVTGSRASSGVICSYTPASGRTFVLVRAIFNPTTSSSTNIADLRNNSSIKDSLRDTGATAVGKSSSRFEYALKGDTLIGDGVKTYDINLSTANTDPVFGSILGYLE